MLALGFKRLWQQSSDAFPEMEVLGQQLLVIGVSNRHQTLTSRKNHIHLASIATSGTWNLTSPYLGSFLTKITLPMITRVFSSVKNSLSSNPGNH